MVLLVPNIYFSDRLDKQDFIGYTLNMARVIKLNPGRPSRHLRVSILNALASVGLSGLFLLKDE